MEFGWSHATIGSAMSINMTLFGLMSPFAAALMDRFGIRPVVTVALLLVAAGSGLTVFMTSSWQLLLLLGRAGRHRHRLDVDGLRRDRLDALVRRPARTGQRRPDRGQRDRPADLPAGGRGADRPPRLAAGFGDRRGGRARRRPAGAAADARPPARPRPAGLRRTPEPSPARRVRRAPGSSARAGARALAGAVPDGRSSGCSRQLRDLRRDHERPDRHALHPGRDRPRHARHHRRRPAGAGRGVRRRPARSRPAGSPTVTTRACCCSVYYAGTRRCRCSRCRRCSLRTPTPSTWVFILFYGLDWVATVPPTVALCRRYFADAAPIVFGWVFAAHQLGRCRGGVRRRATSAT